jgi:hypothetical protein
MAAFGYDELICVVCPSMFVVEPETYVLVYNPATDSYEYVYTPVPGAITQGSSVASLIQSEEFVLEIFVVVPAEEEEKSGGGGGGSPSCEKVEYNQCIQECDTAGCDEFCEFQAFCECNPESPECEQIPE